MGGGEVTITTNNPNEHAAYNTAEALELKRGDWIALSRRMPVYDRVNNVYRELQHLQWYRISDTEETARQVTINGDNHHIAKTALIGKIAKDGLIYTEWSSSKPIEPDPYLTTYSWYKA